MAGIKNDEWIKHMARKHRMIEPFAEKLVRKGKISYGLSSYGYDMRVADEFYIFHNAYPTEIIDPISGHLRKLVIFPTCEIMFFAFDLKIIRKYNPLTNLFLIE